MCECCCYNKYCLLAYALLSHPNPKCCEYFSAFSQKGLWYKYSALMRYGGKVTLFVFCNKSDTHVRNGCLLADSQHN
jgi:hypothetical protein